MPSVYRPRRPRASPLWQIIHHGWDDFRAHHVTRYRKTHGPLRKDAIEVVEKFYRCGDLAQGLNRLHRPDCGHEKLLAFTTCKAAATSLKTHKIVDIWAAFWRSYPQRLDSLNKKDQ